MGHAYPTNISKRLNVMLRKHDAISIKEVSDECIRQKEWLSCAEGICEEPCMIRMALMEIMGQLIEQQLVSPVRITIQQQEILEEFCDVAESGRSISDWDCGEDGNGGEYGIFDAILWRRAHRRRLPVINYICN